MLNMGETHTHTEDEDDGSCVSRAKFVCSYEKLILALYDKSHKEKLKATREMS